MQFSCRFYKNRLPKPDELVMIEYQRLVEMGVYVNLLEYNNIEGMILLNDLTRGYIRSVDKLLRMQQDQVVALILRVDNEKGYLDLSKKLVTSEDISKCQEKFNRGRTVNRILHQTAEVLGLKTNEQFEELYEKTAWLLDEKYDYPNAAYDVFVRATKDEHELDDCDIDENTKEVLLNYIRRRLTQRVIKCRSDIHVACYTYEGIDAVKSALKKGLSVSNEETSVKINLIASPLYSITVTCFDSEKGFEVLENTAAIIKEEIEQLHGIFRMKMKPTVVTDTDELTNNEPDDDSQSKNTDVSSDDSDSDDTEYIEFTFDSSM